MNTYCCLFFGIMRHTRGSIVPIYALSVLAVFALVGFSVDFSRALAAKVQMRALLDQAVLAAANLSYTDDPELVVQNWLESQISSLGHSSDDLTVDVEAAVSPNLKNISATATLEMPASFMRLFGQKTITIRVESLAVQSIPNVEIALVLDISSSMRGERLRNLKVAAGDFVEVVLRPSVKDVTSISVVPFGGSVNIGPSLFSRFSAQIENDDTIFDPEKSEYNIGSAVERGAFRFSSGGECIELTRADFNVELVPTQSRAQLPNFWRWWNNHPWCPEAASSVHFNSNDVQSLKAHLSGMVLSDGTGMDIGALWGLKSLSPKYRGLIGGNFSDRPLEFNSLHSKKVMVIMSDGDITEQNRPKDFSVGSVHTNRLTNREPHRASIPHQGNRFNMQVTLPRGGCLQHHVTIMRWGDLS